MERRSTRSQSAKVTQTSLEGSGTNGEHASSKPNQTDSATAPETEAGNGAVAKASADKKGTKGDKGSVDGSGESEDSVLTLLSLACELVDSDKPKGAKKPKPKLSPNAEQASPKGRKQGKRHSTTKNGSPQRKVAAQITIEPVCVSHANGRTGPGTETGVSSTTMASASQAAGQNSGISGTGVSYQDVAGKMNGIGLSAVTVPYESVAKEAAPYTNMPGGSDFTLPSSSQQSPRNQSGITLPSTPPTTSTSTSTTTQFTGSPRITNTQPSQRGQSSQHVPLQTLSTSASPSTFSKPAASVVRHFDLQYLQTPDRSIAMRFSSTLSREDAALFWRERKVERNRLYKQASIASKAKLRKQLATIKARHSDIIYHYTARVEQLRYNLHMQLALVQRLRLAKKDSQVAATPSPNPTTSTTMNVTPNTASVVGEQGQRLTSIAKPIPVTSSATS
eukprot:m.363445 g.363445  ORF g.363445 m.363445 type:complete len:449 (-) comp22589_c0_seq1:64-1410(-)